MSKVLESFSLSCYTAFDTKQSCIKGVNGKNFMDVFKKRKAFFKLRLINFVYLCLRHLVRTLNFLNHSGHFEPYFNTGRNKCKIGVKSMEILEKCAKKHLNIAFCQFS